MARLESSLWILTAGLAMLFIQRLCEDALRMRQGHHAGDLHGLFKDERERTELVKALLEELGRLPPSHQQPHHPSSSSGGGSSSSSMSGGSRRSGAAAFNVTDGSTTAAHTAQQQQQQQQLLQQQYSSHYYSHYYEGDAGYQEYRKPSLPWADSQAPPRAQGCKKVLWFMGLRAEDAAQMEYYRYMQVALLSARRNAPSLVPYLIFDGAPNDVTAWFERQGGRVILHELSFEAELRRAVEAGLQPPDWYRNRGAYLRLDAPLLFPELLRAHHAGDPDVEQSYFLYTDNDVIFLKDVDSCSFQAPPVMAIGPEHERGRPENTGIMYVNASGLAAQRSALLAHGVAHGWAFGALDQGLVLDYMASTGQAIPVLADELNWKGYWGSSDEAAIVHFHGPKPERCIPCLASHPGDYWQQCSLEHHSCPDAYKSLMDKGSDRGAFYKRMLQTYHALLWQAQHS